MKFCANGKYIAVAHPGLYRKVELFDFDDSTGTMSNPVIISYPSGKFPYGIEFSSDAQFMYVTVNEGNIYQYDLTAGSDSAILNSETVIGTFPFSGIPVGRDLGNLQMAPDGKIYVAQEYYPYLGVIEYPDSPGIASGYVVDGFYLDGQQSKMGLPGFVQSFFAPPKNCGDPTGQSPGIWRWNGIESVNWFDRCNWDQIVIPDLTSDVIIHGNVPFQPIIAFDTAYCKTITIHSDDGAEVTISSDTGGALIVDD
jgi:hypothetical protein